MLSIRRQIILTAKFVNGCSASEWIADQYQQKVNNDSGIVNDFNGYAGGNRILKPILSLIIVIVKKMEIL